MEMCQIFRVIGGTVIAFLTELFVHTKDFEFSKSVPVVLPPCLQRYVVLLLIGLWNGVYLNNEASVVRTIDDNEHRYKV
jgi:hypothetical protein